MAPKGWIWREARRVLCAQLVWQIDLPICMKLKALACPADFPSTGRALLDSLIFVCGAGGAEEPSELSQQYSTPRWNRFLKDMVRIMNVRNEIGENSVPKSNVTLDGQKIHDPRLVKDTKRAEEKADVQQQSQTVKAEQSSKTRARETLDDQNKKVGFRVFVGDEILPTYVGIIASTIIGIPIRQPIRGSCVWGPFLLVNLCNIMFDRKCRKMFWIHRAGVIKCRPFWEIKLDANVW